jgi:ribosome recycling factor
MEEPLREVIEEAELEMESAVEHLTREYAGMRTGRASVHLLDHVKVNYYGTDTPLNQLATISAPEATLLVISPFDPSSMAEIEKAIHRSGLGLTPSNDGRVIRLPVPPLTEERRAELAKLAAKSAEDTKTSIRNHRREANDKIKAAQKNKVIGEDDEHRHYDRVQKLTDDYIKKVDEMAERKKKEIIQV